MVTITARNESVEIEGVPGIATGISKPEIFCLSTDAKPTENLATGSILVEVDTGKVYFFNSASTTWVEQFSFQS